MDVTILELLEGELIGTSMFEEDAIDSIILYLQRLDPEEINQALYDDGITRCPYCSEWVETEDMVPDERGGPMCSLCAEDMCND